MEHKVFPFNFKEMKAEGDGWFVAGLASTWGGQPDSWGDVVAKGAFTESLMVRPRVPLLWQHDMGEPIGKTVSLVENDEGLLGKWSLVPTDVGKKAHQLLEADLVTGLSIGFMTKEAEYRDDGVRVLKAVDLMEVSLVTLGANPSAVVTSFKSDLPTDQLCKQATEALRLAVREAKALHARRADDGRALNDRQREAIDALLVEAKATTDALVALVTPPETEVKAGDLVALEELHLWDSELEMRRLRRKYASLPVLKEA